ncbi:hypothetical protein MMC18_002092 [Xylographa bjoerkii]|nr:hypothetical protein [Xylographa bjoerkii]
MAKFVEYGKVGRALSLLKGLPAQDLVLDQVQMFCVMLLRAELEVENLYRLRSNLLAFMLEAGVRPNRFLANIIILNAMEAGDLNTAWRSHGIATENGLAPDAGTYTALLKGIQHGDNRNNVWLIYKEAKLGGWLSKSPRLKFELLYAIYLSENGKYRDKPYSNLFPYYREFFDTRPLQELGIFHSQQGYYIAEGGQHVEPSVHALGLILLAWLTENRDNGPLLAAYERYVYYTKHNHPLIAQLAQTDHTANAFIVAFGQSPQTVHICTQVVQDMLKAQVVKIDASQSFPTDSGVSRSNGDAGDLNEASNSEHVKWRTGAAGAAGTSIRNLKNYEIRHIAPPTVQTWNILLFAFIRNRQSDAAEKVLALMEARGQKPDRVTWTSLLNGYARMQDFPGTIGTLERMNQAGFKEDEWTVKALSRVVDRVALLRAFERSTKEW